jgi:hypothetical protein
MVTAALRHRHIDGERAVDNRAEAFRASAAALALEQAQVIREGEGIGRRKQVEDDHPLTEQAIGDPQGSVSRHPHDKVARLLLGEGRILRVRLAELR